MRRFKYHYPGDPVLECVVMNRKEFLEAYPRGPILEHTLTGNEEDGIRTRVIHTPAPDEILCDLCSDDPGDEIYVICQGSRGYCKKCAGLSVLPHEIKDEEDED